MTKVGGIMAGVKIPDSRQGPKKGWAEPVRKKVYGRGG